MKAINKNRASLAVLRDFVSIASPSHCDSSVFLGYMPERKIRERNLKIGKESRIREGTIIYLGSTIGCNFQTGHSVLIREQNEIGDNVCIWSNTVIDYGCKIGNNVKIHCNVYIPQFTIIEDGVFIAPGCTFANDLHPGCSKYMECMKGPVIRKGARIGANVTILPRVTVGMYSLVGAGSVITEDVPPYSVVVGNPARVLKKTNDLICKSGLKDYPYKFLGKES